MSTKPIFVATHPRACSTAFERVFMTRPDILQCVHEPFGDAYYYGPERLAGRYEEDEQSRLESGFGESTFQTIFDRINRENIEGKRLFIKDMAQYFVPPNGKPVSIAPSLLRKERGIGTESDIKVATGEINGKPHHKSFMSNDHTLDEDIDDTNAKVPYPTAAEPGNPTVVPAALLKQFHWTFLIRHPRNSIPSYYRCTIPPLNKVTGFYYFRPDEAGYDELRRTFDYLRSAGSVGPAVAGKGARSNGIKGTSNGIGHNQAEICVIDADDLLDNPSDIISAFCRSVGIDYSPDMLNWDNEESHKLACTAFEKWKGFHDDAIHSKDLKPRPHKKQKTDDEYYSEWVEKYGKEGAEIIRKSVEENLADYEYLKQFAITV